MSTPQATPAFKPKKNEVIQSFLDQELFDSKHNVLSSSSGSTAVVPHGMEIKPPGFTVGEATPATGKTGGTMEHKAQGTDTKQLYEAKAMQIAKSPSQPLFMLAFMAWIMGSSLSIYSIFMFIPLLSQPIQNFVNFRKAFEPVEDAGIDLTKAKFLYLFLSCVGMLIPIYKINSFGLLPVTSADWISLIPSRQRLEVTAKALGLL